MKLKFYAQCIFLISCTDFKTNNVDFMLSTCNNRANLKEILCYHVNRKVMKNNLIFLKSLVLSEPRKLRFSHAYITSHFSVVDQNICKELLPQDSVNSLFRNSCQNLEF
jgi:hypothetical protein